MNIVEIRKQVVEFVEEQVDKIVHEEKAKYKLLHFATMSHNLFNFMT